MLTLAPHPARTLAVACPMPLDAPVTRATLPVKSIKLFMISLMESVEFQPYLWLNSETLFLSLVARSDLISTAASAGDLGVESGRRESPVRCKLKSGMGDDRSATFCLGIRITTPLFSQLTKPLRKNQRACNPYRACSALADVWGRFCRLRFSIESQA